MKVKWLPSGAQPHFGGFSFQPNGFSSLVTFPEIFVDKVCCNLL